MYGESNRKVNRSMIMELHGAKDYFGCNKAVLATNGKIMPDAVEVAKRLQIELLIDSPAQTTEMIKNISHPLKSQKAQNANFQNSKISLCDKEYTFDSIWEKYIMPLKGKSLYNSKGENKIIDVNWAEITRITSNGEKGKIDIEPFKKAIQVLLKDKQITRDYINQNYAKRASSGIVLILSQVPFFELKKKPLRLTFTPPKQ